MSAESFPPAGARFLTAFQVAGTPKGAGSKNAVPLGRRGPGGAFIPYTRSDGTPIVNVVDSSGEAGENWRADVRAAAAAALDGAHELADGPLVVRVTFYGASPKGRYGTGRNAGLLKATADRYPHQAALPDGSKLARALEDALTAVVWTDDRRVVDLWWSRRFGQHPGARVEIWTLPASVAEAGDADGLEPHVNLPDQLVIMGGDEHDDRTETLAGAAG